jgi:hypothetical protein
MTAGAVLGSTKNLAAYAGHYDCGVQKAITPNPISSAQSVGHSSPIMMVGLELGKAAADLADGSAGGDGKAAVELAALPVFHHGGIGRHVPGSGSFGT